MDNIAPRDMLQQRQDWFAIDIEVAGSIPAQLQLFHQFTCETSYTSVRTIFYYTKKNIEQQYQKKRFWIFVQTNKIQGLKFHETRNFIIRRENSGSNGHEKMRLPTTWPPCTVEDGKRLRGAGEENGARESVQSMYVYCVLLPLTRMFTDFLWISI